MRDALRVLECARDCEKEEARRRAVIAYKAAAMEVVNYYDSTLYHESPTWQKDSWSSGDSRACDSIWAIREMCRPFGVEIHGWFELRPETAEEEWDRRAHVTQSTVTYRNWFGRVVLEPATSPIHGNVFQVYLHRVVNKKDFVDRETAEKVARITEHQPVRIVPSSENECCGLFLHVWTSGDGWGLRVKELEYNNEKYPVEDEEWESWIRRRSLR